MESWFAKFCLQLPDYLGDEIVEAPTDAISHLPRPCQPLVELRIQLPSLAEILIQIDMNDGSLKR
jgi:hypothetical protein